VSRPCRCFAIAALLATSAASSALGETTRCGAQPLGFELSLSIPISGITRIRLDDWGSEGPPAARGSRQPVATATLPFEQVRELVARGVIPTGVRRLSTGERLEIPLEALVAQLPGQGPRQLTVTLNAWRPGPGLWRAAVEIDSAPLALPAAPR
jgi:hypothetical protein